MTELRACYERVRCALCYFFAPSCKILQLVITGRIGSRPSIDCGYRFAFHSPDPQYVKGNDQISKIKQ